MATIAIVLKTSKKLTNGESPVCLRVTQIKTRKYYSISSLVNNQSFQFRCNPTNWREAQPEDNGLGRFMRSVANYRELNLILELKLKEASSILKGYDETNTHFSFERFERDLRKNKNEAPMPSFLQDYYQIKIEELEKQNKLGLASVFTYTKRALVKYDQNAQLNDVSVKFLECFEAWLRVSGCKDTGISVKMRNLQRVINLAIEDGLYKKENYPFGEKKYSINKRLNHKTRKRSVGLDIIKKIKNLKLEEGTGVYFAQQIFLFSFYTRGMNFIDMAFLQSKDIINNELHYTRRKTGQQFTIPLSPQALKILNYYKSICKGSDYVFPIFDDAIHITEKQKYTRNKTATKKVNDNLKKIAELIGENGLKLTTYVSRHSYATNLKRSGVATSIISEALGHQTEQQTQTYLDEFEKGVISSAEAKIFDF